MNQNNQENVDWNKYREYFPKKYWGRSEFDLVINSFLNNLNANDYILEIGAGCFIDDMYDKFDNYFVLDPFVNHNNKNKPILNWDNFNKNQYNIYICRGSFAYLSIEEINLIINNMPKNSKFIFNTFKNHPKNNIFINSQANEFIDENNNNSLEFASYNEKLKKIEHKIKNNELEIFHTFYYRSEEEINNLFSNIKKLNSKKESSMFFCFEK